MNRRNDSVPALFGLSEEDLDLDDLNGRNSERKQNWLVGQSIGVCFAAPRDTLTVGLKCGLQL